MTKFSINLDNLIESIKRCEGDYILFEEYQRRAFSDDESDLMINYCDECADFYIRHQGLLEHKDPVSALALVHMDDYLLINELLKEGNND